MKITQKITALLIISAIIISAFSFGALGANPVKGSEVANFARQFEGCGYQSLAKGPDKFDCSGLVYYVLKNFGITFGAGTSEYNTPAKAAAFGTVIENIDDAKPGDIVIWSGHTGVYLGNGEHISAMNSRKGVIIDEVEDFIDSYGVKNPYHFFVRPFGYVDETAGEDVEDTTNGTTGENNGENPDENTGGNDAGSEESDLPEQTLTLFGLILLAIMKITEMFLASFAPVANAFII